MTPITPAEPNGFYSLRADDLLVAVRLGWPAEERARPQEVRLTFELRFPEAPAGGLTDDLAGTVCYGVISESLRQLCEKNEFRLLEHLALRCLEAVRSEAGDRASVAVAVCKVRPPVQGLLGGATFRCGDFQIA